jgi:hypothetical protein
MPDGGTIGLIFFGVVIVALLAVLGYGYYAGWFSSTVTTSPPAPALMPLAASSAPTAATASTLPTTQPSPAAQSTMATATSSVTSNPPVLPTPTSTAIVPVAGPMTTSGADGSLLTLTSSTPISITNATYGTANVTSAVSGMCNSTTCNVVALPSGWSASYPQGTFPGQLGSDPQPNIAKTLTINWTGTSGAPGVTQPTSIAGPPATGGSSGSSGGSVKPRQTAASIGDCGYTDSVQGWYDVQHQGVPNDYCRNVGPGLGHPSQWIACALAGASGDDVGADYGKYTTSSIGARTPGNGPCT